MSTVLKKKVLLLWSHLADYTVACFYELSKKPDVEIFLIYQPVIDAAPYDSFDLTFCMEAFAYSKDKENELAKFCMEIGPDVIIMSSWNYKFYMAVCAKSRLRGTYVISTFDGQWSGTLRQRLGIISSSVFLKPSIDNFFVPGDRQAIFARKLGFKNPLQGYYCANTSRFNRDNDNKAKKFLFIGRLTQIKGIEYLISAYKKYRLSVTDPWKLVICGTGELRHICENQEGVEVHGFTQPSELPLKFSESKCLILPSFIEPWGLVVHEAVLAGLAIISSSAVGATTFFVRDGQNGYIINPDEKSLLNAMILITQAGDKKLDEMASISKILGLLWTTEKWADYVYGNLPITQNRS